MKTSVKVLALFLALLCMIPAIASCSQTTDENGDNGNNTNTGKVTAKVIDIELTQEDYAFGVDKDQPELLTAVNELIAEIKANGKLDEICNAYFGDGEKHPFESAALDPSKDQLVVATNAAFEPFEYTIGNKFAGIDMEIAALLAEKLGVELVIQHMEFSAVCVSVGQHTCDIAMAGLTVKEDRKEHVNFSDSYYKAAQKLIVRSNDTKFDACKTADDVNAILNSFDASVKIGAQNGTTGKLYIEGDADWEFTKLPVTSQGYSNGSLAIMDMLNGNIDYVIIDSAPADCITKAINKTR